MQQSRNLSRPDFEVRQDVFLCVFPVLLKPDWYFSQVWSVSLEHVSVLLLPISLLPEKLALVSLNIYISHTK